MLRPGDSSGVFKGIRGLDVRSIPIEVARVYSPGTAFRGLERYDDEVLNVLMGLGFMDET